MAEPTTARATGRTATVLISGAFAVIMLGTTLPTPLYPLLQGRYDFDELMTTVIYAVYAGGVIATLLLCGPWSDQVGRRPMLFAALGLSGLSAVAFLVGGAVAVLFVGRLLSGFSAGIATGTATATIVELAPADRKARGSLVAACVLMGGLGLGPLLAGVLAQYAPAPLQLVFAVDLALVVLGVLAVLLSTETVRRPAEPRLRPQTLRVPAAMRGLFVRAAAAGFGGFAVLGLFSAVLPAFLGEVLHRENRALVGLVVFVAFAGSMAGQLLSVRMPERWALPTGCATLVAAMGLVASALLTASLALLVLGAVVAGIGQGISFSAGLGMVSAASPPDRRAEITSSYFVVVYVGISVPVVGVGAAAVSFGLVHTGVAFAAAVGVLAVLAALPLWGRDGGKDDGAAKTTG